MGAEPAKPYYEGAVTITPEKRDLLTPSEREKVIEQAKQEIKQKVEDLNAGKGTAPPKPNYEGPIVLTPEKRDLLTPTEQQAAIEAASHIAREEVDARNNMVIPFVTVVEGKKDLIPPRPKEDSKLADVVIPVAVEVSKPPTIPYLLIGAILIGAVLLNNLS